MHQDDRHEDRQRAEDHRAGARLARHRAGLLPASPGGGAARRERLASVSARLPPVSRCTLNAMMKKRNSGASMRLAMSHSRRVEIAAEPHAASMRAELDADRVADLLAAH